MKKILTTIFALTVLFGYGQNYVIYKGDSINKIDNNGYRQGAWQFFDDTNNIRISIKINNDIPSDTIYYYQKDFLVFIYIHSKSDTIKYIYYNKSQKYIGYFTNENEFYNTEDTLIKSKIKSYIYYEIFPFYYGGETAFYDYLSKNLDKYFTKGNAKVGFNLDNTGRPTDVEIIKGNNKKLNEFCVKIIKEMPRWQAGYQGGAIVKVPFVIPINVN